MRSDWPGSPQVRRVAAWICGCAGVVAYNWWVLAVLKPGLIAAPSELFSNLEVGGQPYAGVWQKADIAAGTLLFVAFLAAGTRVAGRGERVALLVFAAAEGLGGLLPEFCADGIDDRCRSMEYQLQLPLSQYRHDLLGIVEFFAISMAVILAVQRTRNERSGFALVYRTLARIGLVAYPLLGLAYLTDRYGSVMEAVFFTGFSVAVLTEIAERTRRPAPGHPELGDDGRRGGGPNQLYVSK